MELQRADRLVKILTNYTFLIGRINEETEHLIILKDACSIISQRVGKGFEYSIHKIKGIVTVRGSCCVYEVDESDQFYKAYIQTITGIIPGNSVDLDRLNRRRDN